MPPVATSLDPEMAKVEEPISPKVRKEAVRSHLRGKYLANRGNNPTSGTRIHSADTATAWRQINHYVERHGASSLGVTCPGRVSGLRSKPVRVMTGLRSKPVRVMTPGSLRSVRLPRARAGRTQLRWRGMAGCARLRPLSHFCIIRSVSSGERRMLVGSRATRARLPTRCAGQVKRKVVPVLSAVRAVCVARTKRPDDSSFMPVLANMRRNGVGVVSNAARVPVRWM
jgi:hypothetical protein